MSASHGQPTYVWVVHDPCDCDNDGCFGQTNVAVFASEQTARQEAESRSYGVRVYPDLYVTKQRVQTTVRTRL